MDIKFKSLVGWWIVSLLAVAGLAAPNSDLRLVEAAKNKDQEAVRSLLKQHADVNARQPDGATALMWAVHWDDFEMADLLIRAGANTNVANSYGAAPLWLTCSNGNAAMVEKLLKAGADPNTALPSGETALMAATETTADVVKMLLAHGADVNKKTIGGEQTALMGAVVKKRPEIIRVLIEHGADVNARSKQGITPLMYAVQQGDMDTAKVFLAAGANVNYAALDGTTASLMAAFRSDEPFLSFLLENGADPNAADRDGYTALHYAASRRNMLESVKRLLAHGANPDVRLVKIPARGDSSLIHVGATPFFMAAMARNVTTMRTLADGGANPMLGTSETVFLDGGAQAQGRRLQMVAKTTPLTAAAGSGRYKSNYAPLPEEEQKNAIEAVKLMLELGGDINETNEYGQTALHAAAYLGADTIVQFLVDNGAKIDAMDKYQQTPLSIAQGIHTVALGGDFDIQPRRGYDTTPKLLLKLGATKLDDLGVPYLEDLKAEFGADTGK